MSEARSFQRTRTIKPEHIDELGHVNNQVWMDFVVRLSNAHAKDTGSSLEELRAMGALWIVRKHEIDYHAPGFAGEELLEETWLSELRGARSIRRTRFTRIQDQQILVEGCTVWAYVDAETHRPKRIPKELIKSYERYLIPD